MVYLRQLNWSEIKPIKSKQKERNKMNETVESTVVENEVETVVDFEEIAAPVVKFKDEVISTEDNETDSSDEVNSSNEVDDSLIEKIAEAKAKVTQAKKDLAEARENLKNLQSKSKREKKKGFFGENASDVILETLKEMDGPTSTKDIVSRILETNRYEGSRQGLNATTCITLNALADVGTVKKEGNRRSAKFQIV